MSDEQVEIDTQGIQKLVGRTIVTARRDPPSDESYPMEDETLYLTLDDGSEWEFRGTGYDASSLEIFASKVTKTDET